MTGSTENFYNITTASMTITAGSKVGLCQHYVLTWNDKVVFLTYNEETGRVNFTSNNVEEFEKEEIVDFLLDYLTN